MKLVHGLVVLFLVSCISAAKMRKRPKPAKARSYWYPELCSDYPDLDRIAHEDCDKYYQCYADGTHSVEWCPEDFPVFDYYDLECYDLDYGICHLDAPSEEDPECPLNSNDLVFLSGITCEDYYICNNGVPIQMWCRKGMHWNEALRYCDSPGNAGCDVGLFRVLDTMLKIFFIAYSSRSSNLT